MVQCTHAGRFQMYDYGGAAANAAAYGPEYATRDGPPDIAAQYGRLGGMPVDLVAGTHDGVIPAANIRAHHSSMLAAGVRATYRVRAYGGACVHMCEHMCGRVRGREHEGVRVKYRVRA
eukprot:184134-Chlamydomonas_euryale.AAC.1